MEGLRLSNGSGAISLRPFSSAALPFSHLLGASRQPSHGIPAMCVKMDARCAECERQLAFLPGCASLYCEEPQ